MASKRCGKMDCRNLCHIVRILRWKQQISWAARGSNVGEMTPFVEAYQKVVTSPDSPLYLDWNTPL